MFRWAIGTVGAASAHGAREQLCREGGRVDDVVERAQVWCRHDPDLSTRAELTALIDAARHGAEGALDDLSSRFSGPLEFGTAGLRGAVGAGESRMNIAVVTRASAGVAAFLREMVGDDARVVVGCDARQGSDAFYDAAVGVFDGAGLDVVALPRRLPTPVTAYATRALRCDGGIMITASHNPPGDNGYKVYLGGRATDAAGRGVQIVPPADARIAAHIRRAAPATDIPVTPAGTVPTESGAVADSYVERAAALRTATAPASIRVVLTPMHGVGGHTAIRVLRRAGVPDVHVVPTQFEPDPDFPTVGFPNPEEPGALDAAVAVATQVAADVLIALDPDADRCAVAVPRRDGSWRQLTGDELGALLGEQAATDPTRPGDTLACSIVSSRLLGRIAAHHGLRSAVTLTGFKWIARVPDLRFGYEEAIGYCTDPSAVRDKDGIGTMIRVVTLVERAKELGRTLDDLLDDLARRHGLHATAPLSFRMSDPADIAATMDRLRVTGIGRLTGARVVETTDLAHGSATLPPTDGLILRTDADDRVIIRPSGTEPKLKCYLEVVAPCTGDVVPHAAARDRLDELRRDVSAAVCGTIEG